jgi:hypothetical protein
MRVFGEIVQKSYAMSSQVFIEIKKLLDQTSDDKRVPFILNALSNIVETFPSNDEARNLLNKYI